MIHQGRTVWFKDARFGMFLHWGLYAIPGRGEWVMFSEKIPAEEYARLADRFNPRRYDPDKWVALAKAAGMKYMVLTTRHHDGFCLFDSRVSDFTSVKTAARRDLVAEYVAACRRGGLKIGFYYSLADWRWPVLYQGPTKNPGGWRKFQQYIRTQVRELCTNYGPIDILWYDGHFYVDGRKIIDTLDPEVWDAENLNAMVRELQPGILINDRSGTPEDFDTPEGHVRASSPGRPWETCMTMNASYAWGYLPSQRDPLVKPAKQLVIHLTACAGGGGNYLLNVGPKPDGTIPEDKADRLREVGRWLAVNGEAVYGTERSELDAGVAGLFTERSKRLYLIVHWWPWPETTIALPSFRRRVKSARILSSGRKVNWRRKGGRFFLTGLPKHSPDPLSTVIVLDIV